MGMGAVLLLLGAWSSASAAAVAQTVDPLVNMSGCVIAADAVLQNSLGEYGKRDATFRRYVLRCKRTERLDAAVDLLEQLCRGPDGQPDIGHRRRLLRILLACLEESSEADSVRAQIADISLHLNNHDDARSLYGRVVATGLTVTTGPWSLLYRKSLGRYTDLAEPPTTRSREVPDLHGERAELLKRIRTRYRRPGTEPAGRTIIDLEILTQTAWSKFFKQKYKEAQILAEEILSVAGESSWAADAMKIRDRTTELTQWGTFNRKNLEQSTEKNRQYKARYDALMKRALATEKDGDRSRTQE